MEEEIHQKTEEATEEEEEVSLPDLKSLKNRFESQGTGGQEEGSERDQSAAVTPTPSANVSSLKNRWANMESNSSSTNATPSTTKTDEIQLCRSASQLRAQFDKNQNNISSSNMDGEIAKEEIGQREKPTTISGGLASVKSMFESGKKSSPEPKENSSRNANDESLQAAMARSSISSKNLFSQGSTPSTALNDVDDDTSAKPTQAHEDESLLAARQARGAAAKSLFENGPRSDSPQEKSEGSGGNSAMDELAAIRASRGTNMKALFESGGGGANKEEDGAEIVQQKEEDESLAAARASRGLSNKAMFDGSTQSETTTVVRNDRTDVQAGKAKDLLSRFESGQVNEESKATSNGRESANEVVSSGATKNAKAMFEPQSAEPIATTEPEAPKDE